MTIDLNLLIDFRDLQVALDVNRRAELGWFDTQFEIYGCVYWKENRRYYILSEYSEKIYEFCEKMAREHIICSDICQLKRTYSVPTGMKETVSMELKQELGRQMRDSYPEDFFQLLETVRKKVSDNSAADLLYRQWERISCTFNEDNIEEFQSMIRYFHLSGKINDETERIFQKLICEENMSIAEAPVIKDIHEKEFCGFAYIENGKVKYSINARKGFVYERRNEYLKKGYYVGPLEFKTFYYNNGIVLPKIREMFELHIKDRYPERMVYYLRSASGVNKYMTENEFIDLLEEVEKKYGQNAKNTLEIYGNRWGITTQK